jgi:hypothetical protein
MMEVPRAGDKKSGPVRGKKRRAASSSSSVHLVQGSFYDELRLAEVEEIRLQLDELVDQISEIGEKFARNPTAQLLKQYKSMIREFMSQATGSMFQVEHYTGGRMRQKIYTITKIIDRKLSALTELIVSQQARNLDLLATIDEIRGLLVDLYQ